MPATFRLGTRGSPLALAQAALVRDAIVAAHGLDVAVVPIMTEGDRVQDRPLAEIGGKALWTRSLDRALGEGRTDASVHSMKDVETLRPPELALAAMLPRADVRDRLIGAASVADLPRAARVGTSSPRRTAQLLSMRPDLTIVPLRGNVATRLARLAQGEVDATLLAAAGLDRLGCPEVGTAIAPATMLPAVAQGAIGVEVRRDDARALALLGALDDAPTRTCVTAERLLLAALGGSCHSPVGVLAVVEHDCVWLRAEILTEDGAERRSGEARFARGDDEAPVRLAYALVEKASARLAALFACGS